ncbi:MAG: hypothetical protein GY927_21175 [bacterium]|nr:hypothetical protein [bacterium]
MSENSIIDLAAQSSDFDPLNDLLQARARQLIAQAVEAELDELLLQHPARRTADGKPEVVRNDSARAHDQISLSQDRRCHTMQSQFQIFNRRFHVIFSTAFYKYLQQQ